MGNPTSRVATSQGTFKLSSAVPTMKKRLEIRVAADALKAPLEYPLVVSITMSAKSRKIKFADVPTATVMIGGVEVPLHEGEPPESVEVRSFCKAAHACEIPIVVRSDYSPTVTIMKSAFDCSNRLRGAAVGDRGSPRGVGWPTTARRRGIDPGSQVLAERLDAACDPSLSAVAR